MGTNVVDILYHQHEQDALLYHYCRLEKIYMSIDLLSRVAQFMRRDVYDPDGLTPRSSFELEEIVFEMLFNKLHHNDNAEGSHQDNDEWSECGDGSESDDEWYLTDDSIGGMN